jgi:hypothetical protein
LLIDLYVSTRATLATRLLIDPEGPAIVVNKQHLGTRITGITWSRSGSPDLNQTVTMNRANLAQWE